MKNDEVYKPAFLRHSTFLVHYSIFLFGSGLSGLGDRYFIFSIIFQREKKNKIGI
ncbi:MAG: hypothetical protein JSV88_20165 [Candidatus Aminicenantes bacterium]|nr:MAG: hypothetical protein JSV88_20165 [Candidatus Aminicenantes bacterium]